MQCKEIQEMLSAYIDRALDEQEMLTVENHVNACSICCQELAALQETVKLLQALGEVSPPEEFRGQLLAKLRALPAETPAGENATGTPKLNLMRRWFGGINKYLVAAVIMIGLGVGTGIQELDTLSNMPKDTLQQKGTLEIARDIPWRAAGGTTGSESRTAQEPPEVAGLAADQAKPTTESSAVNSEQNPVKSREQTQAGSGAGNAEEDSAIPPSPDIATKSPAAATKSRAAAVEKQAAVAGVPTVAGTPGAAPDEAATPTDTPAGAVESRKIADTAQAANSQASEVSGKVAGWIFPGVMLAGGIICAGYYFRLRRSKP